MEIMLLSSKSPEKRQQLAYRRIHDFARIIGVSGIRVYDVTDSPKLTTSYDFASKSIFVDFVHISRAINDPKLHFLTSRRSYLRARSAPWRNDYERLAFDFTLAHEVAHAFQGRFIYMNDYNFCSPLFECHADLIASFLMRNEITQKRLPGLLAFLQAYSSSMPPSSKYPPGCTRSLAATIGVTGLPRPNLPQFFRASIDTALGLAVGCRHCESVSLTGFACLGCRGPRNAIPTQWERPSTIDLNRGCAQLAMELYWKLYK